MGRSVLGVVIVLAGCTGGDAGGGALRHGSVELDFQRLDSADTGVFSGTATVSVTLSYLKCLGDFYEGQPQWRPGGPEGERVFGELDAGGEGWKDRLCERSTAECEVASFEQRLGTGASLTVVYEITGELENRTLHFGPIPKDELADCSGGEQAVVRVATGADTWGIDADGELLWETKSFDPDKAFADMGRTMDFKVDTAD